MKSNLKNVFQNSLAQNLEGMTSYLAWAVVCYLTLSTQSTDTIAGKLSLLAIVFCLLMFIVGLYYSTREKHYDRMDTLIRQIFFFVQLFAVIFIRLFTESPVVPVLYIALASQLPVRFNNINAYLGLFALIIIDYLFNSMMLGVQDALLWSSLAGAFNFFAFRMSQRVMQEKEARDEITILNRELIATQALLQESTKQSERLRISRDLHDGLGHNLTALILKLQYLTYTTKGEENQCVSEAHGLAKQLLTDVRETVHEMRERSNIQLKDALDALIVQIPRLEVDLEIDSQIQLSDAKTAETLFRCIQEAITNTLKHGNASKMSIRLRQNIDVFELHVADNGSCPGCFSEGNGLKGMRERIENMRGKLEITTTTGFGIDIQIPNMEM